MEMTTTIFGRSSEGSWKSAGVTMALQTTTARAIAARGATNRLIDLASARPFLSQKGITSCDRLFASVSVPTEPTLLSAYHGGEVREGNRNGFPYSGIHAGLQQSTLQADSRSGRKLFPVAGRRCREAFSPYPAGGVNTQVSLSLRVSDGGRNSTQTNQPKGQ